MDDIIKIRIHLGNAAMETGEHVADLLEGLADRVRFATGGAEIIGLDLALRDVNGNYVGFLQSETAT